MNGRAKLADLLQMRSDRVKYLGQKLYWKQKREEQKFKEDTVKEIIDNLENHKEKTASELIDDFANSLGKESP